MKDILNEVLKYVTALNNNEEEAETERLAKIVRHSFDGLKQKGTEDQFLNYIEKTFQDDLELHIYLLGILLEICKDIQIAIRIYDIMEKEEIPVANRLFYRRQVERVTFAEGIATDSLEWYQKRAIFNKKNLEYLDQKTCINKAYLPVALRKKNVVVIVINQLLGPLHAPSRICIDICKILQEQMGFHVILVVASEIYDEINPFDLWAKPCILAGESTANQRILLNYEGILIDTIFLQIKMSDIDSIKMGINTIYEEKPYFVWGMGGLTIFTDLLRKYTTVMGMAFAKNLIVTEGQIVASYFQDISDECERIIQYLGNNYQKFIQLRIPYKPQTSNKQKFEEVFKGSELFPILIVGNRLDQEVEGEFLQTLYSIMENNPRAVLVFIGKFDHYESRMCNADLKNRTLFLGIQNDLLAATSIGKLFLNPPRQGGGTGALLSINNGIPVITLPNCDVASIAGKEFECNSLEDMKQLTQRYINDPEFYDRMHKKALEKAEEKNAVDPENELRKLLVKVEQAIEENERNYLGLSL